MTDDPARAGSPAWRSRGAWLVLLITLAAALAIDLVSKDLAFRHIADAPVRVSRADVLALPPDMAGNLIPPHQPVTVIPHVLELRLVLNRGAVFGMGQGMRAVFIVFTIAALAFGLWMFGAWTRRRDRIAHVAIGLVLAGGVGNLYDRVRFACVRDFLHPLPTLHWPGGSPVWPYVSNIADAFLLIGIVVLLIHLWRADPARRKGA